ncbi:MAG: NUDIX domain-containing protein [Acidimicrobiales bacterium]
MAVELPDELPVVERDAVRLVVLDADERLLLFRAREITYPELGQWWELPGGGIEAGETYRDAGARELWEEAGLRVEPASIGPAAWRRTSTYRYRGTRRVQHEVVAVAHLGVSLPGVDVSRQLRHETEDYLAWSWTPVREVVSSTERFYPGRLPELLPTLLAGRRIDEPFEHWS